jgi:hypothetical protein
VSFHLSPFPSRFHSSRQCPSPFSYRKLCSPVSQLVKVISRPVDIHKNTPSSAWSVPDVQNARGPIRPPVRVWLLGFWTTFFLRDEVGSPMPNPQPGGQDVSLSLDSTFWPFRHGWPYQ